MKQLSISTRVSRTVFSSLLICAFTVPLVAQQPWLIDEFSIEVGARANDLDTTIRVDSRSGRGTEIDLEDVLGVSDSEDNYGIAFEWRLGRRHMVGGGWATYERSREQTLSRDVIIGDTVFPVAVDVRTDFDIETLTVFYRYYLLLSERSAFGVGLGLRNYDFKLGVAAAGANQILAGAEEADVSGPMPFLAFDYRYGFSPRWRFRAQAGVLDLSVDDYEGTQLLAEAALELKVVEHVGLGLAADFGRLDVETTASRWEGKVESDIVGLRVFGRLFW